MHVNKNNEQKINVQKIILDEIYYKTQLHCKLFTIRK